MRDEQNKATVLNEKSLDELEILVFQMTEIYQRLQHDRDRWSVMSVTLTQAVETLQQQIQTQALSHQDHLKQLKEQVRQESRQILTTTATTVQQTTQQVLKDQIQTTTNGLNTVVQQAQTLFSQVQHQAQAQRWRTSLLALGSALIGSLSGGLIILYILR